jgi:two-component system cell cycle sensor histidine kinase/response regulator CckA
MSSEALANQHLGLVTAIEQSAEAVVITDVRGTIDYVNPAFTRMTGYTREEALGGNPRLLKSGKHAPEFYEQIWKTILNGEVWRGELINRRKDGSLYTEQMNITPVRNLRGEITQFIATKHDVTASKRLDEQLRSVQRLEAIGRLAAGVSHDFNNLLTVIAGYGQFLRESVRPEALAAVEEILRATERASALTRQLLAFSGRQNLAPQTLNLNSVVTNTEKMLTRLIGKDIDLVAVFQPDLGRVRADEVQIEQVIMNLVVNARDAMPGGGKITIETTNVQLDETYSQTHTAIVPGRYVMLSVADTGGGMDTETQAHIFEPFFTTKKTGEGTGLGLATVYGVVKQSGGNIWVYSEPGQGAVFKIYLPRIDAPPPEPRSSQPRAVSTGGSETVLLVEDEQGVRLLVCKVLEKLGYNVLEAQESQHAIEIIEQYPEFIHLLLTDLVMPHIGGKELAKRISAVRPKAKVLYMSGYTDDAVVRHGMLEPGAAFIQKPFTPEGLARKVRETLDS